MVIIVMGVSGSGKSTVGALLAERLNIPFYDADDLHSIANVEKMKAGQPLTDADRQEWLQELAAHVNRWANDGGAVLACSALKEKYRQILQGELKDTVQWVFLEGNEELLEERLRSRIGHFMPRTLLRSQLTDLEKPAYGWHLDVADPPEVLVEQIMEKLKVMENSSEFGLIGLGVMGKSLALNLAGKGITVSIYNRHVAGKEEDIAKAIVEGNPSLRDLRGFDDLQDFVKSLARPRKILLMITAGPAVDLQLEALLPLLEPGDVVIDGGNSFYKDSARRTRSVGEKGIHFVGTGISGGEEGALKGPSLMPGGSKEGYALIAHFLELIAAKDRNGKPCTTYIGPEGAGHFTKMVHNSIEYGEMQALAEAYHLLRHHVQLLPEQIAQTFVSWKQDGLNSYLLEITIDILRHKEDGELLLDKILDQAGQKGTGGWSVGAALEYGVPYSPLTEAVTARQISARRSLRLKAADLYRHGTARADDPVRFIAALKNAYQSTRIINHAVGFDLMRAASEQHGWSLNFSEIARIWTNGCIIRSEFMEELIDVFRSTDQLLLAPSIVDRLKEYQKDLKHVVAQGLQAGFALPVLSAALNYLLGSITADSAANLIQAQRDYFGAHTYQRKDWDDGKYFHTEWGKRGANNHL